MVGDRIRSWVWALRLKLAHYLVGDRSFIANVDVIGTVIFREMTWGASMVRDISIYKDEDNWLRSKPK